ncbi:MAG: hypothetical protein KAR40_07815 [Candidatus Sabulitectum sp.]|nr:hypothetical protein [Candidatus Sabulitectum sp.]
MNRSIMIVFAVVTLVFAFNENSGSRESSINRDIQYDAGNSYDLVLINDWTIADQALGLDVYISPSEFLVMSTNSSNNCVQAYDAVSGIPMGGQQPLDPANESCFGMSWNNDFMSQTYYVNDTQKTNLFFTDNGTSWTTVADPSGLSGRGMDFDGTDYWTTNGNGGGLWRFQPGSSQENISIPEVPTEPSGLTVFPNGGSLGIAVTTYDTHNIYFYMWSNSTLTYHGSAACPASNVSFSYGLAYAESNNHIFWSYEDTSGNFHLVEFSFSQSQALTSSSWGSIKGSF